MLSTVQKVYVQDSPYGPHESTYPWSYGNEYLRTKTERRVKPVGVERLFSPTSYVHTAVSVHDSDLEYSLAPGYVTRHPASWLVGSLQPWTVKFDMPSNLPLLLKIKDQKASLGVSLAEYRETSEMFYQIAENLVRLIRDVRRGKLRKILAAGVLNAPSTWLLYRYGIVPFHSDVVAMAELLAGAADTTPLVKRISHKHAKIEASEEAPTFVPEFSWRNSGSWEVRDVAYVEYENSLLKSATITGLANPIQLTYEIIPLSFVLDWFIDLGDYLAALDALTGVKRVSATRTLRAHSLFELAEAYGTLRYTARTHLDLTPSAPRWEPSLSWKRILDGVSLITQFLPHGKRTNPSIRI